jgi:hypothetical protein
MWPRNLQQVNRLNQRGGGTEGYFLDLQIPDLPIDYFNGPYCTQCYRISAETFYI